MNIDLLLFTTVISFVFIWFLIKLINAVRLVPNKQAYVVERLGRYQKTLGPGFHVLWPVLDRVAFKLDLREEAINVPPQDCFTKDEVKVSVDGVIYMSVMDPVAASYGVTSYRFAAMQLAQTTTRSVIGTLELDQTFEERALVSSTVVKTLEKAGKAWGIRVHRYEIQNIAPPATVQAAMEKQVTAERERRAIVARSEGDKQSRINVSEGLRAELINTSEGTMQQMINEAEGRSAEILAIADATARSIEKIADALCEKGGQQAMSLQLAEGFIDELKAIGDSKQKVLLPMDLTRLNRMLHSAGIKLQI